MKRLLTLTALFIALCTPVARAQIIQEALPKSDGPPASAEDRVGWQISGTITAIDDQTLTLKPFSRAAAPVKVKVDEHTAFSKTVDHALQPGTLADFKVGQGIVVNGKGAFSPKGDAPLSAVSVLPQIDYHDRVYHHYGPITKLELPAVTIELNADVDRPTPFSKVYHSYCELTTNDKTVVIIDGQAAKLEDLKEKMPIYADVKLVPHPNFADEAVATKIVSPIPAAATQPSTANPWNH